LPPAKRAAFGFALAIARTSAKEWLAYASASRLDPTPTVTVGRLQPFGSSATPFVCLLFLKEILFCFLKKHLKKKEKIKRNKVKKRFF